MKKPVLVIMYPCFLPNKTVEIFKKIVDHKKYLDDVMVLFIPNTKGEFMYRVAEGQLLETDESKIQLMIGDFNRLVNGEQEKEKA